VPQPTSPPSAHHYTARLTKDGSLYNADTHTHQNGQLIKLLFALK